MDEMEEELARIQTRKAGGADDIDPEMIKWLEDKGKNYKGGMESRYHTKSLLNKPNGTNHTKREETDCVNDRVICPCSVVFKLYTRSIENRLRAVLAVELEEELVVFRQERRTDNIFILRNIFKG